MQDAMLNSQKKFPLSKSGGHFEFSNFLQKWSNLKLLVYPKPCEIERFWGNFGPQDIYAGYSAHFSKKCFLFPKMEAILNFRIFDKIGKT